MALAVLLGGALASCQPRDVYLTSEVDEDTTRRLDETTYTNTLRGPTTTDERVPESEKPAEPAQPNQAGGNTIVIVPVPGGAPSGGAVVVPSGGGASVGGGVTGGGVTTGGATRPGTSPTPGTSTEPGVPPTSPGTTGPAGGTR